MNVRGDHAAVRRYLSELEREAQVLPPARRAELVAEIGAHLDDAVAEGADPSEAIARLGSPAAIVRAERPGPPRPRAPRWGTAEVMVVLLLTLGWFVVPFVAPLIGVALVGGSPRWTRPEVRRARILVLPPMAVAGLALLLMLTYTFTGGVLGEAGLYLGEVFALGTFLSFLGSFLAAILLGRSPRR